MLRTENRKGPSTSPRLPQPSHQPCISMVQATASLIVSESAYINPELLLLLFSCQVVSNCLWPHGLLHTKLPCPSLSPGVCSNSCPLMHLKGIKGIFPQLQRMEVDSTIGYFLPSSFSPDQGMCECVKVNKGSSAQSQVMRLPRSMDNPRILGEQSFEVFASSSYHLNLGQGSANLFIKAGQ